jgi:hypothetical protein
MADGSLLVLRAWVSQDRASDGRTGKARTASNGIASDALKVDRRATLSR